MQVILIMLDNLSAQFVQHMELLIDQRTRKQRIEAEMDAIRTKVEEICRHPVQFDTNMVLSYLFDEASSPMPQRAVPYLNRPPTSTSSDFPKT
jgi:hypothetical protein